MNMAMDDRSAKRRALDEQIAAEPLLAPLGVPPGVTPAPVETHLPVRRHPVAVEGIVENGLVRPVDPAVKLAESSRVIIVASSSHG